MEILIKLKLCYVVSDVKYYDGQYDNSMIGY